MGAKVTLPDFMLLEAVNYLNKLGDDRGLRQIRSYQDFEYLQDYRYRVAELPGLKEYVNSKDYVDHCYYPSFANL